MSEDQPLLNDRRLLVASGDDAATQHLSWPKMVRANDGALILAYSAGIGHNKGASGLAWSVSSDGGLSFSPPALLCYFPRDDARYHDVGNMAMGIGADGAVILLAMAYQGEVASTVLGWRSADCGRSWQRCDTSALAENRTGSVFGHIFAVPGRGLAVSGHFRSPHTPGIWLAYSMDDGHSWGPPQTVTTELFFEPVFVHAGGRLIGLVRENKACAYHQFVSDDGGMTWQFTARALQGDAHAVHPSPFLAEDPAQPGRLLALVSERAPAQRISLWTAASDCLQWQRLGLVVAGDGDWTYPWLTPIGDKQWFLAYYQGEGAKTALYGGTIGIEPARQD